MDKILFPVQNKYLESFRNETDPLILEIEEYARQYTIPILSWQASDFMEQLVRIKRPRRVLELGTAIAYTSIKIARNLKKKGVLHTIEKSPENVEVANGFIEKSGLGDKIKIYTGQAADVMPTLEKKYDIIFLDADKNDYKKLFEYSLVLLKKGGILFVDNLLWRGYAAASRVPVKLKTSTKHIREFNKMFMNSSELKTTLLPVGDGVGLGIKI